MYPRLDLVVLKTNKRTGSHLIKGSQIGLPNINFQIRCISCFFSVPLDFVVVVGAGRSSVCLKEDFFNVISLLYCVLAAVSI